MLSYDLPKGLTIAKYLSKKKWLIVFIKKNPLIIVLIH